MGFLDDFDSLGDEDGNQLLFKWIENERTALFQELRERRPILEFWSRHPGNPDVPGPPDGPAPPGKAYLLTSRADVVHALDKFSMQPYHSNSPFKFILGIDNDDEHRSKRETVEHALGSLVMDDHLHRLSNAGQRASSSPQERARSKVTMVERIETAIERAIDDAWSSLLQESAEATSYGTELHIDMRGFSRLVALLFTCHLFDIAPSRVFPAGLQVLSGKGYENFIWKIHARHFVSEMPEIDGVLKSIGMLLADSALTATTDSVTNRLFFNSGKLSRGDVVTNLVGLVQGLVDNVMTGTCYAFNQIVESRNLYVEDHSQSATQTKNAASASDPTSKLGSPYSIESSGLRESLSAGSTRNLWSQARSASQHSDLPAMIRVVQQAHVLDAPSPFLPRYGELSKLPGAERLKDIPNWRGKGKTKVNLACAIGSAMNDSAAPRDNKDLRMGYGKHRCIGRSMSDMLMGRMILRLLTLESIETVEKLDKQWGWIVKAYSVKGRLKNKSTADQPVVSLQAKADARVSALKGISQNGLAVDVRKSTDSGASSGPILSVQSTADIASVSREQFARLPLDGIRALSLSQLAAMQPEQLRSLSPAQFKEFSRPQLQQLTLAQLKKLWPVQLSGLTKEQLGICENGTDEGFSLSQLHLLLGFHTLQKEHNPEQSVFSMDQIEWIKKRISFLSIQAATHGIASRPQPFSLWSPESDTSHVENYTSWPGLVDRKFSSRHLPPIELTKEGDRPILPPDQPFVSAEKGEHGPITALFKRSEEKSEPSRSSMLFAYFAQWFTDSFLRADSDDRRRNNSNHEIDMCQLYGLEETTTRLLRTDTGGRLKSQTRNNEEYLPDLFNEAGEIKSEFKGLPYVKNGKVWEILNRFGDSHKRKKHFFATGLERGNSSFGYSAMSTLFLREHNRIADNLSQINSSWDSERIFQTARMILIIMEIKIVIEEYINHIAAPKPKKNHQQQQQQQRYERVFRFDNSFAEKQTWYRTNHMSIEFNLLYRWHSLIPDQYHVGHKAYSPGEFAVNNKPLVEHGLGKILNSASLQPTAKLGLFNTPDFLLGAEYEAIKMARNYRLQSYNEYCKHFNIPEKNTFAELTTNPSITRKLETLYGEMSQLDFLIGLYAEKPKNGKLFGDLMTKMVAYDAFTQALTNPLLSKRIYNKETLTEYGLLEIEKTSSLDDIWKRNSGMSSSEEFGLSMDLPDNFDSTDRSQVKESPTEESLA